MKRILRAEQIGIENNQKKIEKMRAKLSNEQRVEVDLLRYQYSQKIKGQMIKVEAEYLEKTQKKNLADDDDDEKII